MRLSFGIRILDISLVFGNVCVVFPHSLSDTDGMILASFSSFSCWRALWRVLLTCEWYSADSIIVPVV